MKKISYTFLFFFAISCSKDSINTKPSLQLKSFKNNVVEVGSAAIITLGYTDKEADLDSIFMYKQRINTKTTTTINNYFAFPVPDPNKNQSGDVELSLDYNFHLISAKIPPTQGSGKEPDSLIFKFLLKDKQKNYSDTVTSSLIIVKRN